MTETPALKWILSNDTRLVPRHLFERAGLESIMDQFYDAAEKNLVNPQVVILYGADGGGIIQAAIPASKDWAFNRLVLENIFQVDLDDQNLLAKLRQLISEKDLNLDSVAVLTKTLLDLGED